MQRQIQKGFKLDSNGVPIVELLEKSQAVIAENSVAAHFEFLSDASTVRERKSEGEGILVLTKLLRKTFRSSGATFISDNVVVVMKLHLHLHFTCVLF